MHFAYRILNLVILSLLAGCIQQPPADITRNGNVISAEEARQRNSIVLIEKGPSITATPLPTFTTVEAEDISVEVAPVPSDLQVAMGTPMHTNPLPTIVRGDTTHSSSKGNATSVRSSYKTHLVQAGDTLYSLSRANGITVQELMAYNNFKSTSDLKAGGVLLVPTQPTSVELAQQRAQTYTPTEAETVAVEAQYVLKAAQRQLDNVEDRLKNMETRLPEPSPNAASTPVLVIDPAQEVEVRHSLDTAAPVNVPVNTNASSMNHRVVKGETVYSIGRQYSVAVIDILSANNFTKPQDLRAGTVIRIPLESNAVISNDVFINETLAKAKGMVWPARGSIIKSYGDKGNGVTHTGISIKLPMNTPVAAADNGVVIYADEGLQSYGKLVLLRHEDGLVTAYAHNSQLVVQKNDKVQKGQTIAYSGNSGNVSEPQLHFELRRNARAIDPASVLPKL